MSKTNWSKENLEKIVKKSYSIADVLRNLGLEAKGGSYRTAWKYINKYNLDVSHFTGQIWSKSPLISNEDKKLNSLKEILQKGTNFKSDTLKKRLLEAGLKEYKCENPECGITSWCGKDITLELHHINGDHFDNRIENLQLLCPNCHSQTDSYRRRRAIRKNNQNVTDKNIPDPLSNKHIPGEKTCPICGKLFKAKRNSQIYCSRECSYEASRKVVNNLNITKEKIEELANKYNTISDIAKELGLSRQGARNYLDKYGLREKVKEKFDFRAKPVIQYDLDNNFIKEWPSISDAEQTLGLCDIGKCANLNRKSCGGFIWRWK